LIALILYYLSMTNCEERLKSFSERHIIADNPYTEEQEREYFERLDQVEKLFEAHQKEDDRK
jgi:hypothetical protein